MVIQLLDTKIHSLTIGNSQNTSFKKELDILLRHSDSIRTQIAPFVESFPRGLQKRQKRLRKL